MNTPRAPQLTNTPLIYAPRSPCDNHKWWWWWYWWQRWRWWWWGWQWSLHYSCRFVISVTNLSPWFLQMFGRLLKVGSTHDRIQHLGEQSENMEVYIVNKKWSILSFCPPFGPFPWQSWHFNSFCFYFIKCRYLVVLLLLSWHMEAIRGETKLQPLMIPAHRWLYCSFIS